MQFKRIIFISTLLGAEVHDITTLLILLTQIAHFLHLSLFYMHSVVDVVVVACALCCQRSPFLAYFAQSLPFKRKFALTHVECIACKQSKCACVFV